EQRPVGALEFQNRGSLEFAGSRKIGSRILKIGAGIHDARFLRLHYPPELRHKLPAWNARRGPLGLSFENDDAPVPRGGVFSLGGGRFAGAGGALAAAVAFCFRRAPRCPSAPRRLAGVGG